MISLTLAQLAHVLDGRLHLAPGASADDVVSGAVDTDSRLIEPGGIFVAKPGEVTDGHLFVDAAVHNGAAVAIVERPVPATVTQVVVADAVAALADLARYVVAVVRDAGSLRIVGITGSNGKTTTKNLLARILEDEGETVAPRASFNNEVGAPLTMLRVTPDTRYLVSEFGASGPGAIARLAGLVEPDVGSRPHGGPGSRRRLRRHRGHLPGEVRAGHALRPGGVAVLNADDPRVAAMAPIAADARRGGSLVRAGDRARTCARTRWRSPPTARAASSATDGQHRVAAPARARRAPRHERARGDRRCDDRSACSLEACVARLQTVELAERWRMQPLGSDRVRIINDAYNASPDSMSAALRTLAQITGPGERTVAVLGAMSELGEYADEEHDRVGLLAVRLGIQRIVVVGPAARRMYLEAVAQGSWDAEAVFFATADEAYEYLMGELRDGDRVLVKSSNSAGLRFLGDRLGESFS